MCCVVENDIIISATKTTISVQVKILANLKFFFFLIGIFVFRYIVSKLVINIPAPAMMIKGGAIMDNIGGRVPVAPRALNIFIRK